MLREAVVQGVNHIDTSDFYGPHVTNATPMQVALAWLLRRSPNILRICGRIWLRRISTCRTS